jgi:DNA-binding NarL/FixJ family response regulator
LGARGVVLKNDVIHLLPAIHAVMDGQYWVGGRRVSNVVQVVQDLMQSTAGEAASARRFGLTARELEIIEFITQGSTNKDIATRLKISEETVKRHLTNIFNKVGMSNRLELALFAIEHKLAPG